jgi:hypothetical protein
MKVHVLAPSNHLENHVQIISKPYIPENTSKSPPPISHTQNGLQLRLLASCGIGPDHQEVCPSPVSSRRNCPRVKVRVRVHYRNPTKQLPFSAVDPHRKSFRVYTGSRRPSWAAVDPGGAMTMSYPAASTQPASRPAARAAAMALWLVRCKTCRALRCVVCVGGVGGVGARVQAWDTACGSTIVKYSVWQHYCFHIFEWAIGC